MEIRTASCSCGQLPAKISADPIRVSICHCHACQRRTGSVFGVQARFPRSAVEVTGKGTDFVRVGDEGGRCRFTFCPTCGSTVFYVQEGREEHIAIPVGAFADSGFPAPSFSVYEERMHSWVAVPKALSTWHSRKVAPDRVSPTGGGSAARSRRARRLRWSPRTRRMGPEPK